jgi:hypothetical protein
LVDGGTLPLDEQLPPTLQGFTKLNAAQVRTGHDFQHDMQDLATSLQIPVEPRSQVGLRFWLLAACVVVLLAVGGFGLIYKISSGNNTAALDTEATLTASASYQTATAGAAQASSASAAETATAGAVATSTATAAAPFTHIATAPGQGTNCDPTGQWSTRPSTDSETCSATGTSLTANGDSLYLTFTGANGFTFPEPYTASVDVSSMQFSCAILSVSYLTNDGANGYQLQVCADATYKVIQVTGSIDAPNVLTTVAAGAVAGASSYHLTITSNGNSFSFSINSQTVSTQNSSTPPAIQIQIIDTDVGNGPGTMDVSNFSITPGA